MLLPIGFGAILVNLPFSGAVNQIMDGIGEVPGIIDWMFHIGIEASEALPLLLFIGIGAMIDFGPLLANPKLLLLALPLSLVFSLPSLLPRCSVLIYPTLRLSELSVLRTVQPPSLFRRCWAANTWVQLPSRLTHIWRWFRSSSQLPSSFLPQKKSALLK